MKQPIHVRVFQLQRDTYKLRNGVMTLEEYIIQELENGYIITGMMNFTIEHLRVTSYYAPDAAKKYVEEGE